MKKILMSVLVIGVSLGMLGAGTFSYFSDTETAIGNTFTAGTIDIAVDGGNPWSQTYHIPDAKPCETHLIEFDIYNDGENPAVIWKHLGITGEINLYPVEPGNPNVNDIGNWILYDLIVDGNVIFEDMDLYTLWMIHCMWIPLGTLESEQTMHVIQSYHLKPETPNDYQGDQITFDFTLYAEQRLGPGPTQRSDKLFLDNKGGEPDWYFIPDQTWGVLTWDGSDTGTLDLNGMQPDTGYSLIYYVDPWPGSPVTVVTTLTTDEYGDYYGSGITLPAYTGKIWVVLSDDVSGDHMVGWHPDGYLFESNIATI